MTLVNRSFSPDIHRVRSASGPTSVLEPVVHFAVRVSGVVQGVGFRPFIYNLARRHGLSGTVLNNSRGVEIHIEGRRTSISAFVAAIRDEAPAAARVDDVQVAEEPLEGFADFRILASETAPAS